MADVFDAMGKKLGRTFNTMGQKTDAFLKIQKIRNRQAEIEEEINQKYLQIGQFMYQQYVDGAGFDGFPAEASEQIKGLKGEIADCQNQIAQIKGARICPKCGKLVPKDAKFCMECGQQMPEEKAETGTVEDTQPEREKPDEHA